MNKARLAVTLVLLSLLTSGIAGCIVGPRVIEIILTQKTCFEFDWYREDATFASNVIVDAAGEIDQILEANDIQRSHLHRAMLVSASYEVTDFDTAHHDWLITGRLVIQREDVPDGPATLLAYVSQSVEEALGERVKANFDSAGVALMNRAFADYINGDDPILRFTVENSDVVPEPSVGDPLVMSWMFCTRIQVLCARGLPGGYLPPWW